MWKGLKPLTLLVLLGMILALPVIQGCATASTVVPDPTPLEEEEDEEGK